MVNFLLFIVGKTGSGKDTIANYIKDKYNFDIICSYTTRPKREYEKNGVEHYFIDDITMNMLESGDNVIARTKNDKTGVRYCATTDVIDSERAIYIINPEGIDWFKKNGTNVAYQSIYVDLDEIIIKERVKGRGDNLDVFETRINSERDEFNSFRDNKLYDYIIDTNKSKEEMFNEVDKIMEVIINDIETF